MQTSLVVSLDAVSSCELRLSWFCGFSCGVLDTSGSYNPSSLFSSGFPRALTECLTVSLCICFHQSLHEPSLMTIGLGTNLSIAEYCETSLHWFFSPIIFGSILLWSFQDWVSLYIPDCNAAHFVVWAGLKTETPLPSEY